MYISAETHDIHVYGDKVTICMYVLQKQLICDGHIQKMYGYLVVSS